jgi:hypothetical protein
MEQLFVTNDCQIFRNRCITGSTSSGQGIV